MSSPGIDEPHLVKLRGGDGMTLIGTVAQPVHHAGTLQFGGSLPKRLTCCDDVHTLLAHAMAIHARVLLPLPVPAMPDFSGWASRYQVWPLINYDPSPEERG